MLHRQPHRLGLRFWVPVMLMGSVVAIALLGLAAHVEGDEWVRARFGTSPRALLLGIAIGGVGLGIIIGLLNPYVASRRMAACVGAIACFPVCLCAALGMGLTRLGWVEAGVYVILVSVMLGGLYGAVLYEP